MQYATMITIASDGKFINFPNGIENSPSIWKKGVKYSHANVTWDELQCTDVVGRSKVFKYFKFKSMCMSRSRSDDLRGILSKHKVFVMFSDASPNRRKKLRNMHDYAQHCKNGTITEDMHNTLMTYLERIRRRAQKEARCDVQIWNENLEVPILHFKYRQR